MLNVIYRFILKKITPIVQWIGSIHVPFSKKKITGAHYYKWRDKIEIGTVFLTRTSGELSNLINPTPLKHGAVYLGPIGENNICYVIEALGTGVTITDLVTFLTTKDIVIGCKPKFFSNEETIKSKFIVNSMLHIGKPYDFLFEGGNEDYYCFELVARCFNEVYPKIELKKEEIVKDKLIYSEKTYLDTDLFEVLFDSREED